MKAITINVDNNLSQSGTGIISQTGSSTNLMKPITFSPDGTGTKLTYYTGFFTDMNLATEIRNVVPTGSQTRFVIGATNTVLINSSGITLGQGRFICPTGTTGDRITYNTDYVVSTAANILRTNVPTGATQHFSVNNVDVVSISTSTTTIRNNITLPSTQTGQTSGQLGYIHNGTVLLPSTPTNLTTNAVQYIGNMTLPVGVWNVFAQFTCQSMTGSGVITKEEYSLSTTSTTINNDNLEIANYTAPYFTPANNAVFCRRINAIFTSSGSQLVYMTIRYNFTSGTFQVNSTNQTNYCRFYAVRIA